MDDIVRLAIDRGFVYPGSEIYGGLANSWDYGPYGSLLKDNVKKTWLNQFVRERTDMTYIESALLMNPEVWVASGHASGFADPLMDCKSCKSRARADKLVEGLLINGETEVPTNWAGDKTPSEDLIAYIRTKSVKCPECGASDWTDIRRFNLMFKTFQGTTEDAKNEIFLRPETAQGMFVDFTQVARSSRKKLPFGIAQAGKSFRNEITPGNFTYRTREFEQMEMEYFVKPGTDEEWFEHWLAESKRLVVEGLGLAEERVRWKPIAQDELPHYSRAAGDMEYQFPFGWGEIETLANRTDYDLSAHMKRSGRDLSYFDPVDNTKYVPYVIEPAFGLTRLMLAVLCEAYDRVKTDDGERTVLRFKPSMAPITVAVLPVVKKLNAEAMSVYKLLAKEFSCEYDEAGAIGKRYYRFDEIGTPFAIAIDSERYERGEVTVRHRDSGEQETVLITELVEWVRAHMA